MKTNAPTPMLEPAATIIDRLGGPDVVEEITGASRTRVYRWTQPKSKGGTDGRIPVPQALKMIAYAEKNNLPVGPGDFLKLPEAAR